MRCYIKEGMVSGRDEYRCGVCEEVDKTERKMKLGGSRGRQRQGLEVEEAGEVAVAKSDAGGPGAGIRRPGTAASAHLRARRRFQSCLRKRKAKGKRTRK